MTNVFSNNANGANMYDTPTNYPTWTVQSAATGSNQSTVNGAAAPTGGLFTQVPAQTPVGTIADNTQATVQGIAAKLDALNAAMVTAGLEV